MTPEQEPRSPIRALQNEEIESVVGGMTHDTISDDCCKNPRITEESIPGGTRYTVDCD